MTDTPEVNEDLRTLVHLFSNLHDAMMEGHRKAQAKINAYNAAAEATGYVDVETLVDRFYAECQVADQDNKPRPSDEVMTGMMVAAQMKDRVPMSFLDSGSAYGYQWERNILRDFDSEPEEYLKFRKYSDTNKDIDFGINLYHYLKQRLEYSPEWSWFFYNVFLPAMDEEEGDKVHFGEAEDRWKGWLKARGFEIYGEREADGCFSGYTYNHDNFLSQDFVVNVWYIDSVPEEFEDKLPSGKYLVYLTTHNGCDARGGFSSPALYVMDSEPIYLFAQISEFSVGCDNPECRVYWDTGYDGYHLTNQDGIPTLDEFNWITPEDIKDMLDDPDYVEPDPPAAPSIPLPGFDLDAMLVKPKTWRERLSLDEAQFIHDHPMYIDENEQATCPICGKGKLHGRAPYPY